MNTSTLPRTLRLLGLAPDHRLPHNRRAIILAIGNVKGGVGKSTTAMFLALAYALLGAKVLVIDADPKNATSRKWYRRAREVSPLPFEVVRYATDDLADELEEQDWVHVYDLIIIDTGGESDKIWKAAASLADRLLMTMSPSPADMDALPETAAAVREAVKLTGDKPLYLLLVKVKGNSSLQGKAKEELRKVGIAPMAGTIPDITFYQKAYGTNPNDPRHYRRIQHELDNPPHEETAA